MISHTTVVNKFHLIDRAHRLIVTHYVDQKKMCQLFKTIFLGYVIFKKGKNLDPHKVKIIVNGQALTIFKKILKITLGGTKFN